MAACLCHYSNMYIPSSSLCVCTHACYATLPHSAEHSVGLSNSGLKTIIGTMLTSKETTHLPSFSPHREMISLSGHSIHLGFPYCLHFHSLHLSSFWQRRICGGPQQPCHSNRRRSLRHLSSKARGMRAGQKTTISRAGCLTY